MRLRGEGRRVEMAEWRGVRMGWGSEAAGAWFIAHIDETFANSETVTG